MLIEIVLIGITALLFKPLKTTVSNCRDAIGDRASFSKFHHILFFIAIALLAISCLSWILTISYLLLALLRSITPGPEPYVLLPWFIGLVVTSFPWFFADGILGIVRKDKRDIF